jgi:hypothetical protein
MVCQPPCTGGNEARGGLAKDSEERSGRGHLGDPLAREEGPGTIHGVTLPGAWPLRGAPTRTS